MAKRNALYYGGRGKDGKILIYDSNGKYRTKWDASKVVADKLRPLTDIKPKAKICQPNKPNCKDPKVGCHAIYNRAGRDVVVKVVVVEPKKVIAATYYATGKPSKLYEFTINDFALKCDQIDESDERIPRDPPTPADEYKLKLVEQPHFGPDGASFSAIIYHKKKKIGTVRNSGDGGQDKFDIVSGEGAPFRRAVKQWAAAVGCKPCEAVPAEDWWVCFSIERCVTSTLTATAFFAPETDK